jgi:hypothetical protein
MDAFAPVNVRFAALALSISALVERRASEAIGEIRDMAQLARLEHGIAPRVYLHSSSGTLPERFTCPECGGRLTFDIDCYEIDGQPEGVTIYCDAELDAAFAGEEDDIHDGYTDYAAWQSLGDAATRWARKWLRRPI